MAYRRMLIGFLSLSVASILALAAACAPAAESTATPVPTTPPQPTATTAAPTTAQPTATRAAAVPATTEAVADVKVRTVPVLASPPPNSDAKRGGIFRSITNGDAPDFSPWEAAVGSVFWATQPAYDTLLDFNAYEPGKMSEILPNVAYDWWTDASGEQWTFKLHQGIEDHSGTAFTCADAKFMIDTISQGHDATGDELRRSPRGNYVARITGTACPDNFTLEVITDGQLPSLPATLAIGSFLLFPKHVFEGDLENMQNQIGPGIGPFMFESYTPAGAVVFKRNPNYWNQPYPYLDEVHRINLGSSSARDAAMRIGRGEFSSYGATKTIRDSAIAGGYMTELTPFAGDGFSGLQVNWFRSPWKDPRFSRALRCAIDSQKMINTGYDGEGFLGPIFPLSTDPGGSDWGLTREEWLAVDPCQGPVTSEADRESRRTIARDLLAQLGFDSDNVARPYVAIWSGSVSDRMWPTIDDDLRAVGIVGDIGVFETARAYDIAYSGEFDMIPWGFATSRRDPDHWLYEHYYSTSDRNYGKYTNPEVDVLIDLQSRTLDPERRAELVKEVSTILLRDNAKIILSHSSRGILLPPWVRDFYWTEPGNQNTTTKFIRVWIDDEVKQALDK